MVGIAAPIRCDPSNIEIADNSYVACIVSKVTWLNSDMWFVLVRLTL